MEIEEKKYGKISGFRKMNIKVLTKTNEILYEGEVDNASEDIKNLYYYKVMLGNPTIFYVYEDN